MNNFINISRKLQRDRLERSILSATKSLHPDVEQYISNHRFPTLPKIVVYSAASHSDSFLNRIFPFYNLLTPPLSAETDNAIALRIANQLTQAQEELEATGQTSKLGFILKGFPFNTNQALLLDRYLNGVNLVLHLKTQEESPDYVSSIQSLLSYYDQRGTLLQLTHSKESTFQEVSTALDEIAIKIKRSF